MAVLNRRKALTALAAVLGVGLGLGNLGSRVATPETAETIRVRETWVWNEARGRLHLSKRWAWYGHRWHLVEDHRSGASDPPLPWDG